MIGTADDEALGTSTVALNGSLTGAEACSETGSGPMTAVATGLCELLAFPIV